MRKPRVLYVSQEITPYLTTEGPAADICRYLPQGIQERGKEIRTFMPRFGVINERRNQLHEVIRLSGMNLIIGENDHPLIIKVASIQNARMQVYFIDNEEYFQRKFVFRDGKKKFYKDNEDRAIFFCRGVMETVKKLGWAPDIVHCHGWMTSLVPLYIKTIYKDHPLFRNSRVVYSLYNQDLDESFSDAFLKKIRLDGIPSEELRLYKDPSIVNLNIAAIQKSDAVIKVAEALPQSLEKTLLKSTKPVIQHNENYIETYSAFYDELMEEESVLAS
jgi:starch synthase